MKRVVIIASGQTEQRVLPVLVTHLRANGIGAEDVRIPPRNQDITAPVAEKIIKAAWFDRGSPPDKIVLLVDTDKGAPGAKVTALRSSLSPRLTPEMRGAVQYACAQQHLEAWFFADAAGLETWLGRGLGRSIRLRRTSSRIRSCI